MVEYFDTLRLPLCGHNGLGFAGEVPRSTDQAAPILAAGK